MTNAILGEQVTAHLFECKTVFWKNMVDTNGIPRHDNYGIGRVASLPINDTDSDNLLYEREEPEKDQLTPLVLQCIFQTPSTQSVCSAWCWDATGIQEYISSLEDVSWRWRLLEVPLFTLRSDLIWIQTSVGHAER